ncbi:MAG: hypothetical protein JWP18_1048, partial [Solirubrobacterales bacterium]|nr:hypothetical protein [Solirubrobacterales bacterium]
MSSSAARRQFLALPVVALVCASLTAHVATTLRRFSRVLLPGLATLALAGAAAQSASAAGTITVTAGGTRAAANTDAGYAAPLGAVAFEKAPYVSDPGTAVWSPMCTTDATGACTSASTANGRYLVREASASPVGWRTFTNLAWGGTASSASPLRAYVGDVTVSNDSPTVHPSTAWSPTAPDALSGRFLTAKNNPQLPQRCGLDVLLLLDRSGSITPSAATYKSAAQDFVNTLAGTPTRLKIFSFAATSSSDQPTFLDLSVPADVDAANAKISTIYGGTGGTTNWDAGMKLAATAGVDLVTFITDGNPTTRDSGGGGSAVDLLDLTAGMASANTVKTQGKSAATPLGATIRAIGVGSGVTADNLSAMSGPTQGSDYSASGVAGLKAELQTLANQLCGARVHVKKLTDTPDVTLPKSGWTIAASTDTAGVTFNPSSVVTTTTLNDVINVDKIPAGGASVSVAETPQAGYALVASACQKGGFPDPVSGGSTSVSIASVQRGDDWYCTYKNSNKGTIEIRKTLVPANNAGRFDLNVDGSSSEATDVGNNGTTGPVVVSSGSNHTAAETAHAGTTLNDFISTYVCTKENGQTTVASGAGASVTGIAVAAGDALVCTFTNTRKTGTLKVVKQFVGTAGKVNLSIDGTDKATDVGDGGSTPTLPVDTGNHSVGETAGTGTSLGDYASTVKCVDGQTTVVPATSGTSLASVPIGDGDAVICTITHTRKTGTITMTKKLVPSTDPGLFDLTVDGQVVKHDATDNSTATITVDTGDHTVA